MNSSPRFFAFKNGKIEGIPKENPTTANALDVVFLTY